MKQTRYIFLLSIVLLIAGVLTSCINDALTTSSTDLLTFSRDTVSFDTVFTEVGTPTARLIVFNRAKKGVNISSIRFRRSDTEFRLNVDGVSGREFRDVEIRGRDSIYVFIECFLEETDKSEPHLVADDLEFVTNGVTQTVRVEAYGQNVVRMRGEVLTTDRRLTADRPYVVFDSLVVAEGAVLRIDPGVKLLFHDGARLTVRGRIDAVGEPGKMIQMRGDRLDNVLPDVGYDILAGQWRGVHIRPGSYGNRLAYVDMRSTNSGVVVDSCAATPEPRLRLYNSWLHNSQGSVLTARYSDIEAVGCCFSEAAYAVVDLTGGNHSFLQCTFANNYLFSAIYEPLIVLQHCLPADAEDDPDNPAPLMKATFENSIIYGLAADLNVGDLYGSDVFFRYTSLKSGGEDDENFLNCLWDTDPLFYTIRSDYYFNYRLQEDSPVGHAGDPALVTPEARYDMDGADRLSDGNPSLGAYQLQNPVKSLKFAPLR